MGFRAGEGDRGQQRLLGAIWEHQDELIGRVIEISHFGKAEGFRHPQWTRLRDSGDKAPEECLWS